MVCACGCQNELRTAAEHMILLREGKNKEVAGSSYKALLSVVEEIANCSYPEKKPTVPEEEVEEEEEEVEEEQEPQPSVELVSWNKEKTYGQSSSHCLIQVTECFMQLHRYIYL